MKIGNVLKNNPIELVKGFKLTEVFTEDVAEVLNLIQKLCEERNANNPFRSESFNVIVSTELLKKALDTNIPIWCYTVKYYGKTVGFFGCCLGTDLLTNISEIQEVGIYIRSKYRKGFIAKKCIEVFTSQAIQCGCKYIVSGISTGNLRVVKLYERDGYVQTGTQLLKKVEV